MNNRNKKIAGTLTICLLLFITNVFAQTPKGILEKLIEIKYSTELYAISQLKLDNKDSAIALYNRMRWEVDGFIYQLSSQLITHNSPRVFKKIDTWYYIQHEGTFNKSKNKIIQKYQARFKNIDSLYKMEIIPKLYKQSKSLNLTTNVFYLLKDSYSIVKGLSDLKTRKVMAIVELLDHSRLIPPGELIKLLK
jgi:hypothetical protein